jgi:drug/metabolite transporter (DMT)-like permease
VTQLATGPATGSRAAAAGPGSPRACPAGRRGGFAAWAALLVVWVVWGSTYLAIRVADRSLPPFEMAAARYLTAGAVLYPLAWFAWRRRRQARGSPRRAQWAGMAVAGTMLLAFGNGGVSYAEQTLSSGLAALLVASVPLWMALADRAINGRRIRPGGWLALLIGLAGVAVLARPTGHGAAVPVLVVLGASMSWGTGSVLAGRLPAPASPLLGSAMQMLAGGAVLTAIAAATGELTRATPGHVSTQSLAALAYLIGPGSLLALTCYVIALRRLPPTAVSTYAYINPVVAVSLGTLILGERLTLTAFLDGAIIVASVALLLTHQARHPPQTRSERPLHPPASSRRAGPGIPQARNKPADRTRHIRKCVQPGTPGNLATGQEGHQDDRKNLARRGPR